MPRENLLPQLTTLNFDSASIFSSCSLYCWGICLKCVCPPSMGSRGCWWCSLSRIAVGAAPKDPPQKWFLLDCELMQRAKWAKCSQLGQISDLMGQTWPGWRKVRVTWGLLICSVFSVILTVEEGKGRGWSIFLCFLQYSLKFNGEKKTKQNKRKENSSVTEWAS